MKQLLQSVLKYKLLKDNRLLEAVLENPQALPSINPSVPQTNIPPPPPNPTAQKQAGAPSSASIPQGQDHAAQDGSAQDPASASANPEDKKTEGKRPRWEMESALKNLDVMEYHLGKAKDESYMKEMDDQDKEKMEAVHGAMSAMKQTISEMISGWGSNDKR